MYCNIYFFFKFLDASPNPYAYTDVENDPFMVSEKVSANISNSGHLIGFTDKVSSYYLAAGMCRHSGIVIEMLNILDFVISFLWTFSRTLVQGG